MHKNTERSILRSQGKQTVIINALVRNEDANSVSNIVVGLTSYSLAWSGVGQVGDT